MFNNNEFTIVYETETGEGIVEVVASSMVEAMAVANKLTNGEAEACLVEITCDEYRSK